MGTLDALETACACLKSGKVISYPTEAVWGLGCDPFNEIAVNRLLVLKDREVSKGLILVAGNLDQISSLTEPLSEDHKALLKRSWPGPTTWLIPDQSDFFPSWIKGQHDSVAIRVSDHSLVRDLCLKFGGPIVSTSANVAGEPEIREREKIEDVFGDSIDYVVDGELGDKHSTSEIRDIITGKRLR
tara:strand:- start:733 stop:1290 length:558 start_codon:yes stop_codon:yes gene_type:complete